MLVDHLLVHVDNLGAEGVEDVVSTHLLFLSFALAKLAILKQLLDAAKLGLIGSLRFFLASGSFILDVLVENHLNLSLQLFLSDFDWLGTGLLVTRLGTSLLVVVVLASIVATVAVATTTTILVVGHDGALLLHVDFLTVSAVVTSVVATTVVTSVVAATVTAASVAVAATVSAVVVIELLLTCLLCGLGLFNLLEFDFTLGLNVLVFGLCLGPAELLVFQHVKDHHLDALGYHAAACFSFLGIELDLLELVKDTVIVLLRDLTLRFATAASS